MRRFEQRFDGFIGVALAKTMSALPETKENRAREQNLL
jgi:hypothetical protein